MRTLRFIVDGTTIRQDPSCDFTGLFPSQGNKIRAEFIFSDEWKSRVKVIAFWSIMDKEFAPQVVNDDKSCMIPAEALSKVAFKLQVLGKTRNSPVVKTNTVTIYQSGNKR